MLCPDDCEREIVECAGFGTGSEERERPIGKRHPHLAPLRHFSLGRRVPYPSQLAEAQAVGERVCWIRDDGEAVERERQLDELDAGLLALCELRRVDGTRCAGDVDFARTELSEAAAGSRLVHVHLD